MGICLFYCGCIRALHLLLCILNRMASIIVNTYGNGIYYNRYSWKRPQPLWIHTIMTPIVVESHWIGQHYLEWSLLLWILNLMASTLVDNHCNDIYPCGYSLLWPLLLWILIVMATTIVDTHCNGPYYYGYSF